jgi:hypothetical protein
MKFLIILVMVPIMGACAGCATALYIDDPTVLMEGPGLDVTWKK